MKTAFALVASLPLLLPLAAGGHRQLDKPGLERAIMQRMNGSAAGRITQQVDCRRTGILSTTAPVGYRCVLKGAKGTTHAFVTVSGTSWRADWAPVTG